MYVHYETYNFKACCMQICCISILQTCIIYVHAYKCTQQKKILSLKNEVNMVARLFHIYEHIYNINFGLSFLLVNI